MTKKKDNPFAGDDTYSLMMKKARGEPTPPAVESSPEVPKAPRPSKTPDKHPGILPAKSEAELESWELDGIQRRSARFDLLWAPGTRDAIQAAAKAAKISTNEAINQILIRWLRDRQGAK